MVQMVYNPLHFFTDLLEQSIWVPVWVGWLALINTVSVLFWDRREARTIFFTFLASGMLMMGLYVAFGFERILGLGHVLWIPLLFHLVRRVNHVTEPRFRAYLGTLMVSLAISLVIDVRDVWLYGTS